MIYSCIRSAKFIFHLFKIIRCLPEGRHTSFLHRTDYDDGDDDDDDITAKWTILILNFQIKRICTGYLFNFYPKKLQVCAFSWHRKRSSCHSVRLLLNTPHFRRFRSQFSFLRLLIIISATLRCSKIKKNKMYFAAQSKHTNPFDIVW